MTGAVAASPSFDGLVTSDAALLGIEALAPERILGRAGGENFPVALRVLPGRTRRALLAIYGFARLVDQAGDDVPGDRLALLDAVERDLDRAFAGSPQHPILARLAPVLAARDLPRAPFARLIEANRLDQGPMRVETFDDLLAYCRLSANPVGELVLRVFGQASEVQLHRSDAVCSGLQVVEHCQDVAEDLARGRIYLPTVELARARCPTRALGEAPASPALRCVVAEQVDRARGLLAEGTALVASLRGPARLAVAAFAGGGLAACDALAAAGFDPNSEPVRARQRRLLRHTLALLLGRGVRS